MNTYTTSENEINIEHPDYGVLFAFGAVQWYEDKGFQIVSCLDETDWCLEEASRVVVGKASSMRIYVRHPDGAYYPLSDLFNIDQGTGNPDWDAAARAWVRDLLDRITT